jgi:TRAP-type transport system periplasmic protein
MMNKLLVFSLLCFIIFGTLSCARKTEDAGNQKKYSLKVGMVVTDQDPMYKGAMKLKEAVEKRTNGNLTIEVYPSSQLGDTKDMQEQVKTGANIAVITDAARLAEMVPEIGIMGAPYVVKNYEEAKKLTTSPLWKEWEENLAKDHSLRVLSFNWYQGERHLLTNVEVKVPADLKGIRMRTPGATVWQETIRAMGAAPTALAWSEVYPGLSQKVIDAAEAQMPAIWGARLYEVIQYITKTGHFQLNTPLVVSESWFTKLPEDYQDILKEEAFKAGDFASQLTISQSEELEEKMKAEGVIIAEIDKTPFIEATDSVYDKIDGYRSLREQVNTILGK